jgi:hypothetical protein
MRTMFWLENLMGRDRSHRRRWEDNIRTDLKEIGWEGVEWILLTQDWDQWLALANTAMSPRVS